MSRRHRGTRFKGGPHLDCCGRSLGNGKKATSNGNKHMRRIGVKRRFQQAMLRETNPCQDT